MPAKMLHRDGPARPAAEDGARWYAVQCQPHREHKAATLLANQRFEIFLPCRNKTRRHARRIETVRAPFFPGYLFARLDVARDPWRSVNGTVGVVRLVMQGDQPAPAPRGVVEALRDACDRDGVVRMRPDGAPGGQVRMLTGPFEAFLGKLERMDDAGRERVLLEIMAGLTPAFLSSAGGVPPAGTEH